ncbi:MAG: YebC/PmpR family DNA-binding transcriptional regulator [Planctomycetes bacterium]|nr:YebC/PmpR family DNA-binding transcriptional regulator [Planctomycetota bacterium]NUQ35503.1 YebC/PmpR family DNA-binding transcriptional regulator [Planctomycetaceae bacterium]
MAGHNKWSKVKRKKEVADKRRSKVWSSIARDIIVAARSGGGEPSANLRLQYAIAEAKRANMPADTISRAIKRGTGELGGADPEELVYEGYGPGGVALLITALTDNRHRTAPLLKQLLDKYGGKQSAQGSVSYLFETKGRVVVPKSAVGEDRLTEIALEADAEDVDSGDAQNYEIICGPTRLEALKDALRKAGIEWESAGRQYIPSATRLLDVATARKVLELVDALEEEDDVQSVAGNFDIPDDVLAELAGK